MPSKHPLKLRLCDMKREFTQIAVLSLYSCDLKMTHTHSVCSNYRHVRIFLVLGNL